MRRSGQKRDRAKIRRRTSKAAAVTARPALSIDLHAAHRHTVELAERADRANIRGNRSLARRLVNEAFLSASAAAQAAVIAGAPEPLRAFMLKSAAHFAEQCRDYRGQLVIAGISLAPPASPAITVIYDIADRLRMDPRDRKRSHGSH